MCRCAMGPLRETAKLNLSDQWGGSWSGLRACLVCHLVSQRTSRRAPLLMYAVSWAHSWAHRAVSTNGRDHVAADHVSRHDNARNRQPLTTNVCPSTQPRVSSQVQTVKERRKNKVSALAFT